MDDDVYDVSVGDENAVKCMGSFACQVWCVVPCGVVERCHDGVILDFDGEVWDYDFFHDEVFTLSLR